MAVWCVTGKLGSGKTLAAVSRIQKALNSGKRVATNLDIYLEKLINPFAKKTTVYRLPDIPNVDDFNNIGLGYDGDFKGDDHNGLIVLDECAKWLNSRDYRDPKRKALIDWMIHARKKRWDILFIIQDVQALDKQFRDLFCEMVVYCRRTDRYRIPIISGLSKIFTDNPASMPKMHIGLVKYGDSENSPVIDRWFYSGRDIYDAYDTEQAFSPESYSLHSLLPPYYVYGRYHSKMDKLKDDISNSSKIPFLVGGLALGSVVAFSMEPDPYEPSKGMFNCNEAYENLIGCDIHPSELKKIITQYHSSATDGASDSSPQPSSAESPKAAKPEKDVITISGSVGYGGGQFDYVLEKNGVPFDPVGYKVYDVNQCEAVLVDLDTKERFKVFCD